MRLTEGSCWNEGSRIPRIVPDEVSLIFLGFYQEEPSMKNDSIVEHACWVWMALPAAATVTGVLPTPVLVPPMIPVATLVLTLFIGLLRTCCCGGAGWVRYCAPKMNQNKFWTKINHHWVGEYLAGGWDGQRGQLPSPLQYLGILFKLRAPWRSLGVRVYLELALPKCYCRILPWIINPLRWKKGSRGRPPQASRSLPGRNSQGGDNSNFFKGRK